MPAPSDESGDRTHHQDKPHVRMDGGGSEIPHGKQQPAYSSHRILRVSELAAAVHVSPGYLSRFFRQKTGRTVMETIAGKKIEYARQLLDEGNLKVFEVAQRVGFEDTTYFSHVFKKYTGMSAKEYLTQAQRRKRAAAEKTT